MCRRLTCLLFVLLGFYRIAAQTPDDGYYPYAEPEERQPVLRSDTTLFFRAAHAPHDLFGELTDFNLPQVALTRRGSRYYDRQLMVDGAEASVRYASILRQMGAVADHLPGIAPGAGLAGHGGGVQEFRFTDDLPLLPFDASMRLTDRNYLFGARFSAIGEVAAGWTASAAVDGRVGRDMHVDGVFTRSFAGGFRIARTFSPDHRLALLLIVPASERGTRLSSTEEAFELTNDRLYNPAWGFQAGRMRNSRVRRDMLPMAVLSYQYGLTPLTSLSVAWQTSFGVSRYSSLNWYDARTPMPDNYRYLPSYTHDRETEQAWRQRDARYTQIDWDAMIAQNRMASGHAVYALEDRVERPFELGGRLFFTTQIEPRLTLRYGVDYARVVTRYYKQMRDLLGADHVVDIDQYLIDDDHYGSLLQNDLQNPDRVIRTGDRFAYDYSLLRRQMNLCLQAEYRSDRLHADLHAQFGDAAVYRRGHYEKELFPGEGSYGRSQRMRFSTYVFKAAVGWAFSPRSGLRISGMAAAVAPEALDLFCQPLYNNRTVDNPSPERIYAAEADYNLTGRTVDLRLAAYIHLSLDGQQTLRAFDDLSGVYADLSVCGIDTRTYGFEVAASVRLAYRWRLSLAASAGRSNYIRNPRLTVLSDVDNTAVDSHAEVFMGGCQTGNAPQYTACAELRYFGPRGWGVRTSAGYAGGRYVEPALLRRTARVARQGGLTPEAFDALTRQERLGDAFTLDASLFKSFLFRRSRLLCALMLRNLTGSQTVWGGYESMRVVRRGAGDVTLRVPQATRYTYAYPRSFYLSISYEF